MAEEYSGAEAEQLSHFAEHAYLQTLLTGNIGENLGTCSKILDKYQEQAHLLDPFLERLVGPLVNNVLENSSNLTDVNIWKLLTPNFKLIYYFTKVRGYKTIRKSRM